MSTPQAVGNAAETPGGEAEGGVKGNGAAPKKRGGSEGNAVEAIRKQLPPVLSDASRELLAQLQAAAGEGSSADAAGSGEASRNIRAVRELAAELENSRHSLVLERASIEGLFRHLNAAATSDGKAEAAGATDGGDGGQRSDRETRTRAELASLKMQIAEYKRYVEQVKAQFKAQQEQKQQGGEKTAAAVAPSGELATIRAALASFQSQITELLAQAEADKEVAERVSAMEMKMLKDQTELLTAQRQLAKERRTFESKRKKTEKIKTQAERERAEAKRKEDEIRTDRAKIKKRESNVQSDLRQVESERAALKRDRKSLRSEREKNEEELRRLEAERKRLSKEKDRARKEKEKLKKEMDRAQSARDRLDREAKKLTADAAAAQKRRDKLNKEVQRMAAEDKERRREIKEAEQARNALRQEVDRLREEKRRVEKRPAKTTQSSSQEASETARLRKLVSELKARSERIESDNKRLRQQAESKFVFRRQDAKPAGAGPFPPAAAASQAPAPARPEWMGPQLSAAAGKKRQGAFGASPWGIQRGDGQQRGVATRPLGSTLGRGGAGGSDAARLRAFARQGGWPLQMDLSSNAAPGPSQRSEGSGLGSSAYGLSSTFGPPAAAVGAGGGGGGGGGRGMRFARQGDRCKARYSDGKWYTAVVNDVILAGKQGTKFIVRFDGYEGLEEVSEQDIRPMPAAPGPGPGPQGTGLVPNQPTGGHGGLASTPPRGAPPQGPPQQQGIRRVQGRQWPSSSTQGQVWGRPGGGAKPLLNGRSVFNGSGFAKKAAPGPYGMNGVFFAPGLDKPADPTASPVKGSPGRVQ